MLSLLDAPLAKISGAIQYKLPATAPVPLFRNAWTCSMCYICLLQITQYSNYTKEWTRLRSTGLLTSPEGDFVECRNFPAKKEGGGSPLCFISAFLIRLQASDWQTTLCETCFYIKSRTFWWLHLRLIDLARSSWKGLFLLYTVDSAKLRQNFHG